MGEDKRPFYLALIGLYNAHKQYSMQKFYKMNLSSGQPKVLSILSEQEGYLQKDLAKRCHVEPATMTIILKNMVEKDLIYKKRESVSGGKKAYSIHLTEKGRQMANEVNQVVEKAEEVSFCGILQEDKAKVIDLMQKIKENLEDCLAKEGDYL